MELASGQQLPNKPPGDRPGGLFYIKPAFENKRGWR